MRTQQLYAKLNKNVSFLPFKLNKNVSFQSFSIKINTYRASSERSDEIPASTPYTLRPTPYTKINTPFAALPPKKKYMSEDNQIQLFQGQQVRYIWDEEKEQYIFSVVDVIQVLTDSTTPRRYWSDLKRKLQAEGSEVYEIETPCS